ncbi:Periplasmic binding protein-like I,Receptor, ligand binding region [Cinara cedri]|uniref:Periplasmic binding protein-like I,Receptor, ligand binding region n=1 Tax=Cinara cedri TaxID=506608 RepID=A0A5E4MKR8_9HEMI|nr:Periplasmic binding protein-like I,Receptor, ligand binding region [Cinara cedri]
MIIWWFTLFLHGVLALPICQNQQNSKDSVVLSALLPLHSGEECSETQIRGIQQLAALEYGLSKINADLNQYGDVKISLQILDTCSNLNKAVKVTMKGLVSAEQTCIKSPLFLGYVGPDDLELFINLRKITSLLNKTHVLPYKIDLSEEKPVNVFFIGTDQTGIRAKAIFTMMKNLGWESYKPVVEDSIQTFSLFDSLVDLSDGHICAVGKPIILPKSENGYTIIYKEIMENQEHAAFDGVLLIIEKPEALKPLLKILSSSTNVQQHSFVVYIIFVGLKLWELPKFNSLTMVVMQEATEFKVRNDIKQYFNNSLLISYHEQTRMHKRNCNNDPMCLDSLEDELDSTVMPIMYSVHLFANALKMSLDQKCKYNIDSTGVCRNLQLMPATEWISMLRTASTIINGPEGPKRIRFQMETTHHVSIYLWNTITKQLELISTMTNGERLNFIKNVYLPTLIRTAKFDRPAMCGQSHKIKPKLTKTTTTVASTMEEATVAKEDDDWSPIWQFLPNSEKHPKTKDMYHTITVMLCIGFGFLLFMIVMIRMLYNMFKFKQGDDQSSSKKKKKASRRPRRTGSVVSRRLSRASSIISTRSN